MFTKREQKALKLQEKYKRKGVSIDFWTVVAIVDRRKELKKEDPSLSKIERQLRARLEVMGRNRAQKTALGHHA